MTDHQAAIVGGLIVWFAVLAYLSYHDAKDHGE